MNAKTGRQYILQSSASAKCIFCVPPPSSTQESTTLQRVVLKRPCASRGGTELSGFTGGNHLVYVIFSKQSLGSSMPVQVSHLNCQRPRSFVKRCSAPGP